VTDPARAYAAGTQRFMGIDLLCAPGALVPRPETEILGFAAVHNLQDLRARHPHETLRVVDMCCGSGNLACGIASLVPGIQVWACDLTRETTELARANATRLELPIRVCRGDLFAALPVEGPDSLLGKTDVIVCNPPYISAGRLAADRAALLEHEPREAFDGGPYGLSIHQRVVKEAVRFLRLGGWLLMEIGIGQSRQVRALFDRTGVYDELQTHADESGEPRVVAARLAKMSPNGRP
jgi:release factor glutamine methyltransferase